MKTWLRAAATLPVDEAEDLAISRELNRILDKRVTAPIRRRMGTAAEVGVARYQWVRDLYDCTDLMSRPLADAMIGLLLGYSGESISAFLAQTEEEHRSMVEEKLSLVHAMPVARDDELTRMKRDLGDYQSLREAVRQLLNTLDAHATGSFGEWEDEVRRLVELPLKWLAPELDRLGMTAADMTIGKGLACSGQQGTQ